MPVPGLPTLLADIGGTNVRFALFDGARIGEVARLKVAEHATLAAAARAFLGDRRIGGAALAAAGPVEAGRCHLTNHSWVVDGPEFARDLGFASAHVLNDFEAVAWSLPELGADDLHPLGGEAADPATPMVVLGPGTGLGVAALVPVEQSFTAVASEGGHATLAATDRREEEIIAHLRDRFEHVSAERVLCGAGLESLHAAIAAIDRAEVPARDAAAITEAAQTCPVAAAALSMFCGWLGAVAGDLALIFGARGGVFVAGGIPPRILATLDRSTFRRRFEAKGRFRSYLAPIPAAVIIDPEPALLGLAGVVRRMRLSP